MCGRSVVSPLKLFFEELLQDGILPHCWKKAHVVSIHKKEAKYFLNDYRPIN